MNKFDILHKQLQQTNISEYNILNFTIDGIMTIIGSSDLSYYHEVEIYLKNPSYISLPSYFEYPSFREALQEEKKYLLKDILFSSGIDGDVICIELDKEYHNVYEKHYLVVEEFSFKFEMVYHYKRENLKVGERIAEWVK